jgi:hypothetical protein
VAAGGLRIPLQFQSFARLVLDPVPLAIPQRKCRAQAEGPPDNGSFHCIATRMVLVLQPVISAAIGNDSRSGAESLPLVYILEKLGLGLSKGPSCPNTPYRNKNARHQGEGGTLTADNYSLHESGRRNLANV